MSYIHEALKKAQKEREIHYQGYDGVISTAGKKTRFFPGRAGWWICLSVIIIIFLAFTSYSWLDFGTQLTTPTREHEHERPTAIPHPEGFIDAKEFNSRARDFHKGDVLQDARNFNQETSMADPGYVDSLNNLAVINIHDKAFPSSQHRFEKAIRQNKEKEFYNRARNFHKRGLLQDARNFYQETLGIDPGHVDALNNLAVIDIHDKDFQAAQRSLEKAIRLRPRHVDPYYNLACLYALKGEISKSLVHLKKAASLDQSVKDWSRQDTDLDNLRGLSEFDEIIKP